MLLASCDVWDYADLCTDEIVGMELGIHTFHRKLSKRGEEHPILHEARARAERLGKLWTPSNSKHEGLKSALIAANEHIAVTPPLLLFSGPHDGASIFFRDGSIISYVVNLSGRLTHVNLDTSLQGKVRDYGGISDATFLPSIGLLVRFVGLPGTTRIRLVVGGAAQLEHGVHGGSTPRGGNTPRLDRKHTSSASMTVPTPARRGGSVVVHPSGKAAVAWWSHPTVNLNRADNVVIYDMSATPCFTSRVAQQFQSSAEVVAVFWGAQPMMGYVLYVLSVEVSSTFDSIVTLRSYSIARPSAAAKGDVSPGSTAASSASSSGATTPPVDQCSTAVMAGGTAVYAACPVSDRVLVVGQHGALLVIDAKGQDVNGRGNFALPTAASWHPAGVVVAIAASSRIYLFDSMLAPLRASWSGETLSPQPSLRLPIESSNNVYGLMWTTLAEQTGRPADSATNFLVVGAVDRPLAVVEFLIKGPSVHFLRYRWAVKGRLAAGQGKAAVKLLSRLDWRNDVAASFRLLTDVINHFISLPFSQENDECIREAFPPFSWHISDIQHQQYTMWDSRIQALQRRYFQFLLAEKKLTLALYFAAELRSREMLDSLLSFAEKQDGDRAQFVAIVARAAYERTASVTVGFV